jgi:hypothetical protein
MKLDLRGVWAIVPEALDALCAADVAAAAPEVQAQQRVRTVAVIPIRGVIQHRPDIFMSIFGGTSSVTYDDGLAATVALDVGTTTFNRFRLGAVGSTTTTLMGCRFAAFWDRALTASEVSALNAWMAREKAKIVAPAGWTPMQLGPRAMWHRDSGLTIVLGPVTAAGTTPPTVTVSGVSASNTARYRVEITTGGTLGVALFRWSSDGGATWTGTDVATAASVSLGGAGVLVAFGVGTYDVDNVYTWAPVVSQWDDQSGNGFNLAQATAAQRPAITASGVELGVSSEIDNSALASVASGDDIPVTMAIVAEWGSAGQLFSMYGATNVYHRIGTSATGVAVRRESPGISPNFTASTSYGKHGVCLTFYGTTARLSVDSVDAVASLNTDPCAFAEVRIGWAGASSPGYIVRCAAFIPRALEAWELTLLNDWMATEKLSL